MDELGRFLVAYQGEVTPAPSCTNDIWVFRFDAAGICICEEGDHCPARVSTEDVNDFHTLPSVAISREANVLVG